MIRSLKTLFLLLTPAQQRKLVLLQILVLLMSFAEVASVLSIGPFMALAGNLEQLQGDGWLAKIYHWSGAASPSQFLLWAGIASLTTLTLAALTSMYTLWRLTLYGQLIGAELGNRLFVHYLQQPWLFHASGNSAQLTNKIAQEVQRVTLNIINALMHLNAKLVMAVVMAGAIFIYNPVVALSGLVIFMLAYLGIYKLVRKRLVHNGKLASISQALRFKLMSEGFGGIKDVLLLGRQADFISRFERASNALALSLGKNMVMSSVPRYAIELIAYGAVISLVIYLMALHAGNAANILPILSIYALAGMKLLPAFQQIYSSLTQIKGALPAFQNVESDLDQSTQTLNHHNHRDSNAESHLTPKVAIELRDISFTYPSATKPALNQINLSIPAQHVVGFIGASGSGKSTLTDILIGLIPPSQGQLLVDKTLIDGSNLRRWQNSVGLVAQSIFLADASIKENIAFGLAPETIDDAKVRRAATMAHLDELIEQLPAKLDTPVGERGVQLSGGQRQRIGIARALYHDAEVLVLDEATSALDGITEKMIMDAIHDFGGKKTIIMVAHRLATVKKCNWIYMLDKGRVVDQGTYDSLLENNKSFKKMAQHA